jgi:hypothetical protein
MVGHAKLLEFASALERPVPRSRPAGRTDEWRAWAAGLWDGEGSVYLLDHRSHDGYVIGEIAMTQCADGGAPEVLRRIVTIVARGHINGPYVQRGATMEVYRWKVTAQADIEPALGTLWPWLGEVKRSQAGAVLSALRAQPELPRGNPAWGNRKTHCIHGHEYATARVRRYVSRGKGEPRRDSQQCLECLREYARKQREIRRSAADDGRRSISVYATRYLLK